MPIDWKLFYYSNEVCHSKFGPLLLKLWQKQSWILGRKSRSRLWSKIPYFWEVFL